MPGYKNVRNLNADLNDKQPILSTVEERAREYKHSIVTSQEAPTSAVIAHVEGSSWVVDYYSQVKASNEAPLPFDPNQSKLNQQYHLIYSLELKLQSQDSETEDKTNKVGMHGTAVIYAGIIPNSGDVIIADIGRSKAGRLTVINPVKKQYFMQTVYEIEFELVEFIDRAKQVELLDSFVVKRSVFDRNMIKYQNDPMILKEDYELYLDAQDVEKELIDDYLKEFYSTELGTLMVPGYGSSATYDPYVVIALKEVLNINEHPLMYRIKTLNISEIREAYGFSLWPVLLNPEVNRIQNIWTRAGAVNYTNFHMNPAMQSFRYSGFKQCISPIQDLANVDYYMGYAQRPKQGTLLSTQQITSILSSGFGTAIGEQLAQELKNQDQVCCHHLVFYHEAHGYAMGVDSKHYLAMVNKWIRATGHWKACSFCGGCDTCCQCVDATTNTGEDPYAYVLPKAFWEDSAVDDLFCSFIRRYLRGDRIPLNQLTQYISDRNKMTPKDRFYHMMVMLIILRSSIRSM